MHVVSHYISSAGYLIGLPVSLTLRGGWEGPLGKDRDQKRDGQVSITDSFEEYVNGYTP